MKKLEGYAFWRNVDYCLGCRNIADLARESNISYNTIRNQRSQNTLPNGFDMLSIAKVLGTTMEYLMTGEAPASLPVTMEGMDDIVEALAHATLDERNMVRRIFGLRERGRSSSSREDEA